MSIIDTTFKAYSEGIEDRLYYLSNQDLRRAALEDIRLYAQGIVRLVEFEFDNTKRNITINIDVLEK